MAHYAHLIMTALFVLWSLNPAVSDSKVYYITTTLMDPSCPGLCLTLSQFALNTSHLLHPNTTLVFLQGTHYLNDTVLMISNVDNFAMQSENSTAHIACENYSSIYFNHSSYIEITNLEFIGCGGNQVICVEEFVVQDTKFKGQDYSGTALEIIETTTKVVNTAFVSNKRGSYRKCVLYDPDDRCYDGFIGGAIIATNSTIDINQSKFEDNGANFGGAIFVEQNSIISMSDNAFIDNNAIICGGALFAEQQSIINVNQSEFSQNAATIAGGVLYSHRSNIKIEASKFQDNIGFFGGGMVTLHSNIRFEASEFRCNSANVGGAVFSSNSTITIVSSNFHDNSVNGSGGVMVSSQSAVVIEKCVLYNNRAMVGGVLLTDNVSHANYVAGSTVQTCTDSCTLSPFFLSSTAKIEATEFHGNTAIQGGVLHPSNTVISIGNSNFTNNSASIGSIVYSLNGTEILHKNLLIDNNLASENAVLYIFDSSFKELHDSESFSFSRNLGSLLAFNSNITFISNATFVNNQAPKFNASAGDIHEGGAITLFQSNAFFDGKCSLEYNYADNGGSIHSTESKIYVNGYVSILHNTASKNGGGIYLTTSELNCQQKSTFILFNNTAAEKGGGVHAVSSSIKAASALTWPQYTGTRMKFTNNMAKKGGGMSLEANAKLYILKYDKIAFRYYPDTYFTGDTNTTIFTGNSAEYGGAVYVDDGSISGTCANDPKTECFLQVLAIYGSPLNPEYIKTQSIFFSQNYANISGSTLYGGLLDRCAVSQFAEVYYKYKDIICDGIAYFKNISIPTYYSNSTDHEDSPSTKIISVESGPVRVCLCIHNTHNCTQQSRNEVKKGETFTKSLIAVDQIGQPVSATIQSSLSFADSGLAEGQLARTIPLECTNLTFNIVSQHTSEILTLYASDSPCKDAELSRATVEVHFLQCSCPIGLQVSGRNETNCTCECHSDICQYVEKCDSHTGSFYKQPQHRAWISYINDTDLIGYLIYPNCPFDYCLLISPPVDLNQPDGADAQCAFNRSSLLCGSCRPGLSLSLGNSRCLQCPSYWPALLVGITIAAILAGIALVTFLLVLNMTVAVGTLNGLIFYANVVHYANKSILLSSEKTNFVTVFVSWLNLEVGIDTCYFPGMDTYIKTWLQLVFPAYVIFLVVLIIVISSCSSKFSNLIGKRDPVATLATLILLSYAKFLEVCFKVLSVGILENPDEHWSEKLWLPDATIKYLSGKHIPLFIAAVFILLVCLVYTVLLFSWQCLLHLPRWRVFGWSRNPKIQTFIETYHTPYNPKHRYWTGLLLIVRIILYLIAAANASNDPTITLTAIIFIVCYIVLLKGLLGSRLQKNLLTDVLETFFYFNILFFATFSWYCFGNKHVCQGTITSTSVTAAIIVSLLTILCHVYTDTGVFTKLKKTKFAKMMEWLLANADPKLAPRQRHYIPPPDDDIHRFDELLDELDCPINTDDYNTAPLLRPETVEPTLKPNFAP